MRPASDVVSSRWLVDAMFIPDGNRGCAARPLSAWSRRICRFIATTIRSRYFIRVTFRSALTSTRPGYGLTTDEASHNKRWWSQSAGQGVSSSIKPSVHTSLLRNSAARPIDAPRNALVTLARDCIAGPQHAPISTRKQLRIRVGDRRQGAHDDAPLPLIQVSVRGGHAKRDACTFLVSGSTRYRTGGDRSSKSTRHEASCCQAKTSAMPFAIARH